MRGAPDKHLQGKCRICGEFFKTQFSRIELCSKCWSKQPKCRSCHIIMAAQYGSLYSFARMVGHMKICSGCDEELRSKGCLRISETQFLLASGKVRHAVKS